MAGKWLRCQESKPHFLGAGAWYVVESYPWATASTVGTRPMSCLRFGSCCWTFVKWVVELISGG